MQRVIDGNKVHQFFKIDYDELYLAAEENGPSSYARKCLDFYEQVKNKDILSLTYKQQEWLGKIEDDQQR